MTDTDLTALTFIRDNIRQFSAECEAAQYTDTEAAWLLLEDIEETMADIVKRHAEGATP